MNAEETIAGYLAQEAGYRVDPERLYDGAAAKRSRDRVDRQESLRRFEGLALRAKKAIRAAELAHFDWSRSSTPANLAGLEAAMAARTAARDELMEACLQDEELYADVVAYY